MAFFRPEAVSNPPDEPATLFEKIWHDHLVREDAGASRLRIDHIYDGPDLPLAVRPGEIIACVTDDVAGLAGAGAFGALAIRVDGRQADQIRADRALACAPVRPVRVMADGILASHRAPGVGAVDLALSVIRDFGTGGADGLAVEFWGQAVRNLTQEGRMTVTGLIGAAGAAFSLIGPDERSFSYMRSRGFSQARADRADAAARSHALTSDRGASWAGTISLDANELFPMVSFGPELASALPIAARLPAQICAAYGLDDGVRVTDLDIVRVTVGGQADGRLDDLRSAAAIVARAGPVAPGVAARVVPANSDAAARAVEEGLDQVFIKSGFSWGGAPSVHVLSSAEGTNTAGTYLMSPAMAAGAAVAGRLVDIRKLA